MSALFDDEGWDELRSIFEKLPESVLLDVWGDPELSYAEKEANLLCQALSERFDTIRYRQLPRRVNYPYYPVVGVMGEQEGERIDHGVRIIGLPSGYQMTSLITAIQAVSFRAATLEPATRIKLHKLKSMSDEDVVLELMTSADDEGGPLMAKIIFGLAVADKGVRSFLIMSDMFPEANLRYSVKVVPHIVINGRVHVAGVVEEEEIVRHVSVAVGAG
jgi:alkyl hydroperoxide reductase subunit AhpF